jgi:hypothetical protein
MEETLRMAQVSCGALREALSGSDSGESAVYLFSHSVDGGRGRDWGPAVDSVIGFSRSNYRSAGVASKPAAAGLPRPASESTCEQTTEASSSGGLMP